MHWSSVPYIWILAAVIPLGVRMVRDQGAFFAALAGRSVSEWVHEVSVALFFTDANRFFTTVRERRRELRTRQPDDRLERLRQRANRSRRLVVIATFGPALAGMVGTLVYVLWHGPVR